MQDLCQPPGFGQSSGKTVVVKNLFLHEKEDSNYLLFYLKAKNLQQTNEFLTAVLHSLNDLSLEFMQEYRDMDQIQNFEMAPDLDTISYRNSYKQSILIK